MPAPNPSNINDSTWGCETLESHSRFSHPHVAGLANRYARCPHSHSMVPGGLEVQSSTTRLTSGTELVIRLEMRARTS